MLRALPAHAPLPRPSRQPATRECEPLVPPRQMKQHGTRCIRESASTGSSTRAVAVIAVAGSLAALLLNCPGVILRFPVMGVEPAADVTFHRTSSCGGRANLSHESGSAGLPTLDDLASQWSSNASGRASLARPDDDCERARLPREPIADARSATPCERLLDAELLHALCVSDDVRIPPPLSQREARLA